MLLGPGQPYKNPLATDLAPILLHSKRLRVNKLQQKRVELETPLLPCRYNT